MSDDDSTTSDEEDQECALPADNVSEDGIARLWMVRDQIRHQRNVDELARERSGNSSRHLMLNAEDESEQKHRREDEHRRAREQAEDLQREIRDRTDRLLRQIEQRQAEIAERRREIEERALRLHDGRKVFVDGGRFRDEDGALLEGRDHAEAAGLRAKRPEAATWQERQKAVADAEAAERLHKQVLRNAEGGTPAEQGAALTQYEKEFAGKAETRAAQTPADYGSADFMDMTDEYQISSRPAFTEASIASRKAKRPMKSESDTTEMKKAPQLGGQGPFKP